jgi:hypothetical protein
VREYYSGDQLKEGERGTEHVARMGKKRLVYITPKIPKGQKSVKASRGM